MVCKHIKVQGDTTKYFYCTLFNKSVDEYKCKNCMMRIKNKNNKLNELFGQIFVKGLNNQEIYNTCNTKNKEKQPTSFCKKWQNNKYTK